MMVGRLGSHTLFVVGFVGLTCAAQCADPQILRKIVESGQVMPDGRRVASVVGHARDGKVTGISANTTPPGSAQTEFSVYKSVPGDLAFKPLFRTGSAHGPRDGAYNLVVSPTMLSFDTYGDGLNHNYAVDNSGWFAGGISYDSLSSDSWTTVSQSARSLGFYNSRPIYFTYQNVHTNGNNEDTVQLFRLGGPTIAKGYRYYDYNNDETTWKGWVRAGRFDSETDSMLLDVQDLDGTKRVAVWKKGVLSPYSSGEATLPGGTKTRIPLGKFRGGITSGIVYGSVSSYVLLAAQNESRTLFNPGDLVEGLNGITYNPSTVSHHGFSAVSRGSFNPPTGWGGAAIVIHKDGKNSLFMKEGDALFGSTITDLTLQEDALEADGFHFWYELADGRTGIAHSNAVPEPGTLAALGLGALLLRRRKR